MTLERAIVKAAPQVFEKRLEQHKQLSPKAPPPPPYIRSVVTIAGITYDILLGDEDAKLNINGLYHETGPSEINLSIARVVDPAVGSAIRTLPAVEPVPLKKRKAKLSREDNGGEEPPIPDPFRSWGEVFDVAKLKSIVGNDAALPNVTTGITCWGSGQLNMERASDDAILAITSAIVSDSKAKKMLERYRENPTMDVQTLLRVGISDQADREVLAGLMTDNSLNFSVWISASAKADRAETTFTVTLTDDEGVTQTKKFAH